MTSRGPGWVVGLVCSVVLFCMVIVSGSAHACAGCSNPNLPTGRSETVNLQPGQVAAAFNITGTTMNVIHSEHCPDIGPICDERNEPPQLHDLDFYVAEFRPVVEVGITPVFGAELQVPVRYTRTTVVFRRINGDAFEPDYENIHHRNETLFGIGDPWLMGRAAWRLGEWRLNGKLGASLPIGRTEEDPFVAGRAGEEHQHIQYGTGTFNPITELSVARDIGGFDVGVYGQATLFLYENKYAYQAGNRFVTGLSAQKHFESGLRVGLGTDLLHEEPERWAGEVQQDGNVGRTDLLVGGNVGYGFGSVGVNLAVKVPVWQKFAEVDHTHGDESPQLEYPAIVNLGMYTTFGG